MIKDITASYELSKIEAENKVENLTEISEQL